MICAYDKLYLEQARNSLASMLDYAVYDLGYDLDEFLQLFIDTGIAEKFECRDISVLAGRSGVELAWDVMYKLGRKDYPEPKIYLNRSPQYWLGWALGYYQWATSLSFKEIFDVIAPSQIIRMYSPYHEMDIEHFVEKLNEYYMAINHETKLKVLRLKQGLSQKELADFSGVPLRTIQQYEQRQKNINRANAESIIMLSRVLFCKPEDLMENVAV